MNGLIHEKLDIKILILYALRRLSGPADIGMLCDICQCDAGVGYFELSECLGELVDAGQVSSGEDGYLITGKGLKNAETVDSSLPYSVRRSADRLISKAEAQLSRMSMVNAAVENTGGGCYLKLSLSDGKGELMNLRILCSDEKQATAIKKNYKRNAEKIYMKIIEAIS